MMLIATLTLTTMSSLMAPALEPAPEPAPCLTEIQKLFEDGSIAAAAREANTCWDTTGDRNALFMAIQLYRRLGRCAHVLVLTRRLLSLPGLPPVDRDALEIIEEQCREQSVELRVRFTPSTTDNEELRAELLGTDNDELRMDLSLNSGEPGDRTVHLDPGEWLLRLERDSDVQTLTVNITATTEEVAFPDPPPPGETIDPKPVLPPPLEDEQPRQRSEMSTEMMLGYGTLAPAVALAISGAVITGVGTREYHEGLNDLKSDPEAGTQNALNGAALTSQGMASLGASLGVGAVALTNFVGADERTLYAETAVGGALSIAGLTWTLVATQLYEQSAVAPKDLSEEYFRDRSPQDLAAHGILGLGVGLATSAAVSLLVTKLRRRKGRAHARHVARRGRI